MDFDTLILQLKLDLETCDKEEIRQSLLETMQNLTDEWLEYFYIYVNCKLGKRGVE